LCILIVTGMTFLDVTEIIYLNLNVDISRKNRSYYSILKTLKGIEKLTLHRNYSIIETVKGI